MNLFPEPFACRATSCIYCSRYRTIILLQPPRHAHQYLTAPHTGGKEEEKVPQIIPLALLPNIVQKAFRIMRNQLYRPYSKSLELSDNRPSPTTSILSVAISRLFASSALPQPSPSPLNTMCSPLSLAAAVLPPTALLEPGSSRREDPPKVCSAMW